MLSCQDITELVTDYAEGRLGLWDRLCFQVHLGMCKVCRTFVHNRRVAVRALGKAPEEPIPPEGKDELLARFRDWKR